MSDRRRRKGKFVTKGKIEKSSAMQFIGKQNTKEQERSYDIMEEHSYSHSHDSQFIDETTLQNTFEIDPEVSTDWRMGRRVVELSVLAEKMICVICGTRLHLLDTLNEEKQGLGSVLTIKCSNSSCGARNRIPTGTKEYKGGFEVHMKLVLGMLIAGMGATHVNNFLTAMNLPYVDPSTIKKKEDELAPILLAVARESCRQARLEEVAKSKSGAIQVCFDAGWQKRGTGLQYNSDTGHAVLIGKETGKVLDFTLRSRVCRICQSSEGKEVQVT